MAGGDEGGGGVYMTDRKSERDRDSVRGRQIDTVYKYEDEGRKVTLFSWV